MLSPLTRGYGSWDGAHYDPYSDHATEEKLPLINEREIHRHGVTIGHMSRCSTSLSFKSNIAPPATPISRSEKLQRETTHNRLPREITSVDQTNKYDLPKTYLTKKGALMLFTAPKEEQELDEANGNPKKVKMHRVKKLLDSTLQMGSLDRLAMSILQYGDEEEYDKENTSISDEKHKLFMKILRKAGNQREVDMRSQPGSDLHSYLRDLKFRARASMSGDTNIPRSREAMELRAILQGLQDDRWPIVYNTESGTYENRSNFGDQFTRPASQQSHRPQTSPGSGTATPRSILSASKLRASLKSYNTYMGRPATDETVREIRSSLPTVGMRHSSAPSIGSRSLDIMSPGKGRRRTQSSITGGSIVEEEGGFLPLYYDPLSGMEGSSIAYTDSTDLGQHMYTFDLASGESSLFDVGSHGDGIKPLGEGGVDVVEKHEKESDVEMSYVVGQGSTEVASEPQSSSNHLQVVVEDHDTNTCDYSTQYDFEVDCVKGGGDGVPSSTIGGGVSTNSLVNSLVDISSAISSQHDPLSETEKLDVETSTTISEDLIEPPGVNKVDIKTIAGVIPEEESVGLGFDGEGVHIPQGNDEVDEGELDCEEKGEEAACTEVDLARYGIIGEEDNGEGDDIEESTDEIRVSPKPDSAQGKSPAPSPAQPTKTHDPTSPPKQEPDSSQIKASLSRPGSRASSKSTSPQIPRTPSPSKQLTSISQSNKKSPSPVPKTVSPSQKPDHDKSSSVEVTKPCPSPEIRGKNTPPSVTITKKQSQIQNNLSFDAQKDTVTSPSHTVGSVSQVSSEKSQSNQEHTDIKSVKSEEALPNVPFSSSDQTEQGAPAAQQAQVMDGGAPAQTSLTSAIEKEEKSKQEDENEESHESSVTSAEDKRKKKQLQSNDEQKDYSEIEDTSKTGPEAPTRLIDQMPVIPDYLKPKPQKTPKTKEKKTRKQQPSRSKKDVTKAMSVASIQPEAEVTGKEKSAPKVWEHEKVEIPPEKEEIVIPDHMKEAFSRDTEQSKTALEEQMKQMANILDDTFKATIDEELLEVGLTEEELLEAKMEVEEKLNVAQAKINEMEKTGGADLESEEAQRAEKEKAVKLKEGKAKKKGGKGGKSTPKDTVAKGQGKSDKELEKQKKLEEKRKLEDQIQERQELVEEHEQRTRDKELELKLEVDRLRREEIEMQEAVDEVHKYLAESRKRQREDRDQRRKADQDRRREHAREKFEQDKKKREEDSRKVMDELDRIHDLEMRKQKKLEEEMRREEEERLAIEEAEEEENSRVKAAEDQERRLREIELQMEEEEMQRLYLQEQEISRQRILLEMEREKMTEEEELKRQELLAEQIKLEEIKRKKEEEEQRVLDEQRRRLMELKEMEEAAKLRMQQDLEERRAKALARREDNLENKSNMDKLKQSQGITKAWVFSYFVRWPLESYMVPIGGDETKKKGFRPKTNRPKTAK